MKCQNCGSEINNNSKFCSKCGAPIQSKNKLAKKIFIMVFAIFVIGFCLVLIRIILFNSMQLIIPQQDNTTTNAKKRDTSNIVEPTDMISFIDKMPLNADYNMILEIVDSNIKQYSQDKGNIYAYVTNFDNLTDVNADIIFIFDRDNKLMSIEIDIYSSYYTENTRDVVFEKLKEKLANKYPDNKLYTDRPCYFYSNKTRFTLEAYGEDSLVLHFSPIDN